MIDFNPRTVLAERLNQLIDAGIEARQEEHRTYLGCSAIGDPCERAAQLTFAVGRPGFREREDAPVEQPFPARIRRIFERGHDAEDRAARWLASAGLVLATTNGLTGEQFEVSFCNGRLLGHADGILLHWLGDGPAPLELPALWECKCLGHKYVVEARRKRIRSSHPKYYAQMQLYMRGLKLDRGLITCIDADTMELHHELVERDDREADRLIARAERILAATDAGEWLPRSETSPVSMICKMCRHKAICWGGA